MSTDVFIAPNAVIRVPPITGDHVSIDGFVYLSVPARIGSYVHIACHCSIIGGKDSQLIMEDFSFLSAGCRLVCGSDEYRGESLIGPTIPMRYRKVTHGIIHLERFSGLGTGVIVHPNVTIGEGTVVGSGSVVTKSLEPWGIYVGSPAHRVNDRRRDIIEAYAKELLCES